MASKKPKPKKVEAAPTIDDVVDAVGADFTTDVFATFLETGEIDEELLSPTLLRYLAMLVYTTDLSGISVADLGQRSPFAGRVPLTTLADWAAKDCWHTARLEVWGRWRQRVEDAVGDRVLRFRMSTLEKLESLREKTFTHLLHDFVPNPDAEGTCLICGRASGAMHSTFVGADPVKLMGALVKVIAEERNVIGLTSAGGTAPGAAAGGEELEDGELSGPAAASIEEMASIDITPGEAAIAARAILTARLAAAKPVDDSAADLLVDSGKRAITRRDQEPPVRKKAPPKKVSIG